VLVWAGGGGDDLAKSPHMARIGNSVYRDICPNDPTCSSFGFYQGGIPTPMMENSLLYKLTQYGIKKEITLDSNRYTFAFQSKYGKCRIFKISNVSGKSKKWIADPANRVCDAPGSWYCSGQYPPAMSKLIAKRHNFKQLEDFNAKKATKEDEKYQEQYHGKRAIGKGDEGDDDDEEKPKKKQERPKLDGEQLKFVGCYGRESELGADKEYGGGPSGANINMARSLAYKYEKKYIAVARAGEDGHSFAFNEPPKGEKLPMDDEGCMTPCMDFEGYVCGCADGGCATVEPVSGEEHKRRWVVYEVPKKTEETKKEKKKKNKKNKNKKAEDEL